jgi:diguanylate cyclase (GGDEF)-like protein
MPQRNHTKLWAFTSAGLALAQALVSGFMHRGYPATVLTDFIYATIMATAMLAFGWNSTETKGRIRLFWILQAIAWAFLLCDQFFWILYDVIWRRPIPALFVGDALLFLAQVPILAGLLLRPNLQPSKPSTRLGAIDFFLLMSWWVYLYVFFVLGWQYVVPNPEIYNRNYDHLYLAENFVLTIVLAILWAQTSGRWKTFYAVFAGAQMFNLFAFYTANDAIDTGAYYTGSWYDVPLAVAMAGFALVALLGRGLLPRDPGADKKYDFWMAGLAMMAVLSLPAMAIWSIYDADIPPSLARFRVVVTLATMALMAFLVFVKQHRLGDELQRTNDVLEEASLTDPLTGVRNRRYFAATIEGDVGQVLRSYADHHDTRTQDLVFYLVDADNFKEINDLYGHDAGDQVLVEMTRRISTAIRNSDVLVRWGGEEFLIVSRYTDRAEAETLAARVLAAAGDRPYLCKQGGTEVFRTCSIGWAAFPWLQDHPEAVGYEEVLTLADLGLNHAKRQGKNRAIGMLPGSGRAAATTASSRGPARLQFEVLATVGPAQP